MHNAPGQRFGLQLSFGKLATPNQTNDLNPTNHIWNSLISRPLVKYSGAPIRKGRYAIFFHDVAKPEIEHSALTRTTYPDLPTCTLCRHYEDVITPILHHSFVLNEGPKYGLQGWIPKDSLRADHLYVGFKGAVSDTPSLPILPVPFS